MRKYKAWVEYVSTIEAKEFEEMILEKERARRERMPDYSEYDDEEQTDVEKEVEMERLTMVGAV